ncbi:MAG: hydrogenase expression protein HupH [Roseibium sp.]|nr:hydrogenase expression protein HupH [Roseibium sp.]
MSPEKGPVLLINPNGSTATTRAMARIARQACPSLRLKAVSTPGGPDVITTPDLLDAASRAVAGCNVPHATAGVIVAAFGDPGRKRLAERLDCPVLGIAEAGIAEAARGGRAFSIATTTPDLIERIREAAHAYGHGDQLISVQVTKGPPLAVMSNPDRLQREMRVAIKACAEDGAEAVVIGGGPLATVARQLSPESPLPLIEPVPEAARRMALMLQGAKV